MVENANMFEVQKNVMCDRINSLRKERGMTQKELCETCGFTNATYQNWIKGKGTPSLDCLYRLSAFFGVSIDYLTGNSNYRNIDTGMISDITGLKEDSIETLKYCTQFTAGNLEANLYDHRIITLLDFLLYRNTKDSNKFSGELEKRWFINEDNSEKIGFLSALCRFLFIDFDQIDGNANIKLYKGKLQTATMSLDDILPSFIVTINSYLEKLRPLGLKYSKLIPATPLNQLLDDIVMHEKRKTDAFNLFKDQTQKATSSNDEFNLHLALSYGEIFAESNKRIADIITFIINEYANEIYSNQTIEKSLNLKQKEVLSYIKNSEEYQKQLMKEGLIEFNSTSYDDNLEFIDETISATIKSD